MYQRTKNTIILPWIIGLVSLILFQLSFHAESLCITIDDPALFDQGLNCKAMSIRNHIKSFVKLSRETLYVTVIRETYSGFVSTTLVLGPFFDFMASSFILLLVSLSTNPP